MASKKVWERGGKVDLRSQHQPVDYGAAQALTRVGVLGELEERERERESVCVLCVCVCVCVCVVECIMRSIVCCCGWGGG